MLEASPEDLTLADGKTFCLNLPPDAPTKAPGPAVIRPMIELISVMDAGEPMRVTSADYADPGRWWL